MHVERTFTVPLSVEAVFAYLGDFTHTNEWDPGTEHTERTTGDGGLGTTYLNVSSFMGRSVRLRYETITFKPPTSLQFRGHNGKTTATDSMTFTPTEDGGTSIHYRADFAFPRVLGLVVPPLIRRKLEKVADETVEQIKRSLPAA